VFDAWSETLAIMVHPWVHEMLDYAAAMVKTLPDPDDVYDFEAGVSDLWQRNVLCIQPNPALQPCLTPSLPHLRAARHGFLVVLNTPSACCGVDRI
jgi:hypothetical protein